ncbi:STAS domain-containing protein [Aerophototrophica crusticola]|uniref:STAS domain-containing protein n=1 Tax=Aerophototrophica crusticola TaxID=1709002 RepID=A0A858R5Z3_9PROT|nr:STAS domain-containing protein [Rhodospirillaceae bacterium B3]
MEDEAEARAGGMVLVMQGRLTLADHDQFREILDMAEGKAGSSLSFDLSALSFIDSNGLGMLLMLRDKVQGRGGRVILRAPRPTVAGFLRVACLHTLFDIDGLVPA